MKQDMILVLDLGSEENTVIAREIRSLGVYSEIHPHDITAAQINSLPNVKGIILNGGPNRIVSGERIDVLPEIRNCGIPILDSDHNGAENGLHRQNCAEKKYPNLFLINVKLSQIGTWKTLYLTK